MTQAAVRDEFDAVVVPPDGRRGAHRARAGLARSLAAPLAVGLVAVGAGAATVAVVQETVLGSHSSSRSPGPAVAADAAATSTTGSTTGPTSTATAASSSGTSAAATTSGSTSAAASTSPSATTVLRSTPVVVLNTTGTAGLAARTAARLTSAGWSVASTGNTRVAARSTLVEYVDPALAATAASLARSVGGTAQHVPALSSGRLVVVLGPGATG